MSNTLESRDLGGIIGETFGIYGRNFLRLIAIVAPVSVILGILGTLAGVLMLATTMTMAAGGGVASTGPLLILIMIVIVLASIVGYALMQGAVAHAISEHSLGRKVSIGRAYSRAFKRLAAMIGAELLAGLAIFGMCITVIGIPFAIYFGVRWYFIWQAAVVEGVGPRAALSSSSDLVSGNWGRVFGIMFVVGLISGAISLIVGFIPIVGQTIAGILVAPILLIASTLLYFDLRVRQEGYNVETMARELGIGDEPGQGGTGPIVE